MKIIILMFVWIVVAFLFAWVFGSLAREMDR